MSRYANKKVFRNATKQHKEVLDERGLQHVDQFATQKLRHPTAKERGTLDIIGHVWQVGDRYYKLAYKHYGASEYWWVIAWFNRKPTESHVKIGDVVEIPMPLDTVLNYMRV